MVRSILLHVYDDDGLESRLQAAFDLARAFDGHVTCLHATPFEDYLATDPLIAAEFPEDFSDKMRLRIAAFRTRVEARLTAEGVNWDWMHVNAPMADSLSRMSILADVIVVSLGGPALMRREARPLAAKVAIGAGTPVLGIPADLSALRLDRPAMIAWDGSPEAGAALRAAVPILRLVPSVHLLEVVEKSSAYPRDLAARYLSRHGLTVEIIERQPVGGDVARTIADEAEALGAGLVVMGAYGHSRLRELLLGGATRDLTRASPLPLLLAH